MTRRQARLEVPDDLQHLTVRNQFRLKKKTYSRRLQKVVSHGILERPATRGVCSKSLINLTRRARTIYPPTLTLAMQWSDMGASSGGHSAFAGVGVQQVGRRGPQECDMFLGQTSVEQHRWYMICAAPMHLRLVTDSFPSKSHKEDKLEIRETTVPWRQARPIDEP